MSQIQSNSLWGICLKPNEVYTFKGNGLLQIQQCNLNAQPMPGKTTLEVHTKGHTYTLCTLTPIMVECQLLSHVFMAEDQATLKVKGVNEIHVMGILAEYDISEEEESSLKQSQEDDDDDQEHDTVTGFPTNPTYLSDLLGPDLPEEDDDDEEEKETVSVYPSISSLLKDILGTDVQEDDDDEDDEDYVDEEDDEYGPFSFRDVNDNNLLRGFELRHFKLVPDIPGYETVDLREQEDSMEESLLNDSIATGLINGLLNSGDNSQMEQGLQLKKKLERYCKERAAKSSNKKVLSIDDNSKSKKKKKRNKHKLKKALKMMKKKQL